MSWFSALGIGKKLGLVVLVLLACSALLVAVTRIGKHAVDSGIDAAEEKGAAEARAESAQKGLEHVEQANRAAAEVAVDPVARNAGCKLHSRTPENC